jgi:hypothetical protein
MAQSAPIIPINAKMYRHFAIATVMITGCLALFASGENREALAETIEAQQRQTQIRQVEQNAAKKGIGKKGNFADKRKTKGSFGSDADIHRKLPRTRGRSSGFAETIEAEQVAASEVTFSNAGTFGSGPPTVTGALPPGMSPAEWEQMTSKKKIRKAPPPSRRMTEKEAEAMLAASDARSQTRQD